MAGKLLGNLSQGLIFVVSAPAGTGKTTLVNRLKKEFNSVIESISCTTRKPREGEIDGQDYHFLTLEQFKAKINIGDFLEYAEVFGNYYGTSREYILSERSKGKHLILVIDTQGAMQLKKMIDAIFIFLQPPSIETLRDRLYKRNTENEEQAEKRLTIAKEEMAMIDHYDYSIVNEDVETAYHVLRSILIAEEHRVKNRPLINNKKGEL